MPQLHKSSLRDLPEIGACHAACFPDAITVKLGIGCVEKSLEWFLVNEHCFMFHIADGRQVTGYCGGFIPRFPGDGSASGMLRYTAGKAIRAMLRRPWLILHKDVLCMFPLVIRNLFRKFMPVKHQKDNEVSVASSTGKSAGLVVIGVHPDFRGTGVFEMLMQQFESEARARNIRNMHLSVKPVNTRAVNAYKKYGWDVVRQNEAVIEMVKHL